MTKKRFGERRSGPDPRTTSIEFNPTAWAAEMGAVRASLADLLSRTSDELPPLNDLKMGEAPRRDPWAHRSAGMRCATCMWFVEKGPPRVPSRANSLRRILGRCRRHAPTMSGFPAVFDDDWCGDHKLDENRV